MKEKFTHYFRLVLQIYVKQPVDTLFSYFSAFYWSVHLSSGGTFVGQPKFNKTPNSSIIIGKNVRMLSSFSSNLHGLNRKCMISTLKPNAKILIGNNVGLSGVVICSSKSIIIGDRVMIGANTTISDTDSHSIFYRERHPKYFKIFDSDFNENVKNKQIKIEDDVFIGMNSLILKGSKIGKGSVIGAGSIVVGEIPENVIAAGVPAKIISKIEQ